MEPDLPPSDRNNFVPGAILIGIGALFLLANLHLIHARDWVGYWPVILIAVGLVQLVDSVHSGGRVCGGVLMGLGGLLLADNLGYLHFDVFDLWPLILIVIGIMMLWRRTWGRGCTDRRYDRWRRRRDWPGYGGGTETRDEIEEIWIFSGSKRSVVSQQFRGGRIVAIFGGVEMDFTPARIAGDAAVLEVTAIFGGAELRIPSTWSVEVRGAGIFGGFGDHTVHPPITPETQRLIVRGGAVFGGVSLKN